MAEALLLLSVGVALLIVVDTAFGLARGGERLLNGDTLDVAVSVPPERLDLAPGLVRHDWIPVQARIEDPDATELLLSAINELSVAALVIIGLWLVRGILRSVRRGDPFDLSNLARLRGIGLVLVVGAPVVGLLRASVGNELYDRLPDGLGEVGSAGFIALPIAALLAGLVVFVLSEVFAHGLRLRADLEGTI